MGPFFLSSCFANFSVNIDRLKKLSTKTKSLITVNNSNKETSELSAELSRTCVMLIGRIINSGNSSFDHLWGGGWKIGHKRASFFFLFDAWYHSFFTSLGKKTVKIMFHEGTYKENLNLKNSLAITALYCTAG